MLAPAPSRSASTRASSAWLRASKSWRPRRPCAAPTRRPPAAAGPGSGAQLEALAVDRTEQLRAARHPGPGVVVGESASGASGAGSRSASSAAAPRCRLRPSGRFIRRDYQRSARQGRRGRARRDRWVSWRAGARPFDGPADACKLGVLAFGDSITNGGGELQWGVALQSWALWMARGLGLPYTPYAVDGAAIDVRVSTRSRPSTGTRPRAPATTWAASTSGSTTCGSRIGTPTVSPVRRGRARVPARALRPGAGRDVPLDLGRPRAGAKVETANRGDRARGRAHGALVLDLRRSGRATRDGRPRPSDRVRTDRDRRAGARGAPARRDAIVTRPARLSHQLIGSRPAASSVCAAT